MKKKAKVLIVEDEVLYAMCLEEALKKDFEVCGNVVTGEEAVETAARVRPDAAVIDIRLAGAIDGIEAAQAMLAGRSMRIVFLTGYSDAAIRKRAENLRPAAYLVKPVSLQEIRRVLHEAL